MLLVWNITLTVKLFSDNEETGSDSQENTYTVTDYTSDISEMIENVRGSVVGVNGNTGGSGVIMGTDDGVIYVVTARSIAAGNDVVTVTFDSGASLDGTVIGVDEGTGIAVVSVTTDFTAEVFSRGDSDLVDEGEYVVALQGRNADTLSGTVSLGIAAQPYLTRISQTVDYYSVVIQTDISFTSANLGEPLVDAAGELVGIVVGSSEAVGVNDVVMVFNEILTDGTVSRGILPIAGVDISSLRPYQKNERGLSMDTSSGVLVTEVNGSAEEVLAVNDVVLSVNDEEIDSISDLREVQYACESGDQLDITIMREGETMTVSVTAE